MLNSVADEFARELTTLVDQSLTSRSPALLVESLTDGCWIYGAGGYGQTIWRLLKRAGVRVKGFIDQRGSDAKVFDAPDALVVRRDEIDVIEASRSALVVGMHNFTVDQRPIVEWGRQAGFRDILTPGDLPDLLGEEAGSYWLTSRRHVRDNIENIRVLLSLLADEQSREVVAKLARFRATGRPAYHPASCLDDQYFPLDLPPIAGPVTLLDGGAYTGDTHEAALRRRVSIEQWLAFEPALDNFRALTRYAAQAKVERATLFPCGLSDECRVIQFAGDAGAGSRAASGNDANHTSVHVVAADDVLKGAQPTLVKLDVEGHERQALDGMRVLIERNRPRLAVSIYHEPADLWEIPAKVAQMMPDARLYVRQHGCSGFDTVLYAMDD